MCAERRPALPARQRGLSLIELLAFIVIVSVGLAGIISVLNLTVRHSPEPMLQKQALAVAESLLEEIESKPFTYCDPDDAQAATATAAAVGAAGVGCTGANDVQNPASNTGETRYAVGNPFDNVGDYNGFAMNGIRDPATGATVLTGLGGYTAAVATEAAGADFGLPAGDVLRIRVTVTSNVAEIAPVVLIGYRFRYAPNHF